MGGYGYSTGHVDFTIMSVNRHGTIDNNYSADGLPTTDFGLTDEAVEAMLLQPDVKIDAACTTRKNGPGDFAIARFNTDDTPESNFSYGGIEATGVGPFDDNAYSLALQPDGKILL